MPNEHPDLMAPVLRRADPIIGVILAGGRGRRMGGRDKGLLALGGVPMLGRVIEVLRPQVSEIVLNANGDPDRFDAFGIPVITDSTPGFAGPLAGVLAGLNWVRANRPEARFIVTAASDTPFFPSDLVNRFRAAVGDRYPAIAIAGSDAGQHAVFGLWPTALADDLEATLAEGKRKALAWADRHNAVSVAFSTVRVGASEVDPFFNINSPEDLTKAEAILSETAP